MALQSLVQMKANQDGMGDRRLLHSQLYLILIKEILEDLKETCLEGHRVD